MTNKMFLLAVVATATGCIDTTTDNNGIEVWLEPVSEEMKSLPIMASGKTSLLDQDVADSHGEISMRVRMTGTSSVKLADLDFRVDINGTPLDLEIARIRLDEADASAGIAGSTVVDNDILRINFRAKNLAELLQPEGEDFDTFTAVKWEVTDLGTFESDTVELDQEGYVAAAVNTGTFALRTDRVLEAKAPTSTAARIRASVETTNGLSASLQSVKLQTIYFGAGTVPSLGLALVDSPATQIDNMPATQVAPGKILDIYTSSSPSAANAPYTESGTAATTGNISGGKALVLVEISYTPTGMPATNDVLAFLSDVQ